MTNLTHEQQTEKYLTEKNLISELKRCWLDVDCVADDIFHLVDAAFSYMEVAGILWGEND